MSEKPRGNFADIYTAPDETVQAAHDADVSRVEPRKQASARPKAGKNGPVELIAKADDRVWDVAKIMLAEQDVYADYQPDGSVILRNGHR